MRYAALIVPCLLALTACAGTQQRKLAYADQAQAAYADALEDYFDDDCMVAEPAFLEVRRNYPYSRFAALSELRAADCMMNQAKYPEAIQSYQRFVRYHPSHAEVPYARFQIGRANYAQMPSEWLLSPPAYERDQRFTHDAVRLLRRFILDFPAHPLVGKAQEMVGDCIRMLAAHELYVANFYFEREVPEAAVGRLETLLRSYAGSGYEAEALLLLGRSYAQLSQNAQAKEAYLELLSRYPDSEEAPQARKWVSALGS